MSVSEAWVEMQDWMAKYVGDRPFILILTAFAAVYLLFFSRMVRRTMVVPLLLMAIIVINPFLYARLYKDLRYWRFFWMFPEIILIGIAFADVSRRMKPQWLKSLSLAVIAAIIILIGKYAFAPETIYPNSFEPTANWYKVSAIAKQNCDIILADNPTPKCIFQHNMCETRQVSGEIMQLYGRDANGYIMAASPEALEVDSCWHKEPAKQEYIFQYAEANGYTHICCDTSLGFDEMAAAHGFSILSEMDGSTIYHRE